MDKNYLMKISDIPLMEYNNIFGGNLIWMERGLDNDIATYDLVVREMPEHWSFYIMDGLERFLDVLLQYGFDEDAVTTLKEMGFITSDKSEEFYRNFKFSGDVHAMKDGTVFYPGEPIVRITAPLLEANLLTAFILNAFSYPIRIMSKVARWKLVTDDRAIFIAGALVRLPGLEQGIYSAKDAFIMGSSPVSPLIFRKFPEYKPQSKKFTLNVNHAVIKSFPTERDAYAYVFDELADRLDLASVMVDTYDARRGLEIFIEEFKKRKGLNQKNIFVCIDSGDIEEEAIYFRKVLDENGLEELGLTIMSNLDENVVDTLLKKGIKTKLPIAGTEQINITDNPRLECVYKMAELVHSDGAVEMKAKLAKGKESYPGRKQVYRIYEDGEMVKDIIGFEDEELGTPLLEKFIEKGELVRDIPTLDETKELLGKELSALPTELKKMEKSESYKVEASDKLLATVEEVREKMAKA